MEKNLSPDSTKPIPDGLNLTSIPGFSSGSCSNVSASPIDPNYFRSLARWWSINLDHKVNVIVTLTRLLQCCTAQGLTSKQCNLIPTDGQLEIKPGRLQGNSNNLLGLNIFERPSIKADRSRSEFVDFRHDFSIANNPSNSLTDVICFKPCSFPDKFINLVVKLGGIPAVFTLRYFQYLIASVSKSPQSFIDFWSKLYRDYKLALNRQGLSHEYMITHPATDMETSGVLNPISFPQ